MLVSAALALFPAFGIAQVQESSFRGNMVLSMGGDPFCQAVKVSRRIFLTAGHCARDILNAGADPKLELMSSSKGLRVKVALARPPRLHPSYAQNAERLEMAEFFRGALFEEVYKEILDLGLIEIDIDTPGIPTALFSASPLREGRKIALLRDFDCRSGQERIAPSTIESLSDNLANIPASICEGTSGGGIFDEEDGGLIAITGASAVNPDKTDWAIGVRLDNPSAWEWLEAIIP